MGGKKGPEKNRKYEKDRRDRFNDQFVELHKLLPDFNSLSGKATKAEIITKTIQYLKESHTQTRKLESEFENEKIKVSELQKKVNGVLQIVKELIKILHKSNIRFPSSLPVDDFKTFQDVFVKTTSGSTEKNDDIIVDCAVQSPAAKCDEKNAASNVPTNTTQRTDKGSESVPTASASIPCSSSKIICSDKIANSVEPQVLKVNSNALILPSGNFYAVNNFQNGVLNYCNSAPPLLLNRQLAVPTLVLMQNNFVPVNTVQHITVSQQSQKLILPKQTVNTTKTTFINKKPIPTVRLYKSVSTANSGTRKAVNSRRRRSRRSKGILVKYPKRKPPTKNKKRELRSKKSVKLSKSISMENESSSKNETFIIPPSEPSSFPENSDGADKTYSCADNMLNTPEIPSSGQFIDFFESTSSRCMDTAGNNNSSEFTQTNDLLKGGKSQIDNFVTNTFERSFSGADLDCDLIRTDKEKEANKKPDVANDHHSSEKTVNFDQTSSTSNSMLKYAPSIGKSFVPINSEPSAAENNVLEKPKSQKELASLRSTSKDLNLSLIDDKKHYESSFDEFSNDLFTSLQVPPNGHNTDSISPTAAFLQTFPLVSNGTNVDLLPEHEEDSVTTTTPTTILQIGNLDSPSTMLFSSKSVQRNGAKTADGADASAAFASYGGLEIEGAHKEKKDMCKKVNQQSITFADGGNFNCQKSSCSKDVPQNTSFYSTSTASTFSSYNIFTKYNDFPPPVTSSYYSFCSQSFASSKTTDSVGDFTSWMPSAYAADDSTKDKTKRDKCVNAYKSNAGEFEPVAGDLAAEQPKTKKLKPTNNRPLVNWMTTPDLRNTTDVSQPTDPYALGKEEAANMNAFMGCNSSNNVNFNAYSGADYFSENQNYSDSQLASCKITYPSANPTNYSWSPSKTNLTLPRETPNMIIPSTLPTLVGDLALGNTSFNNYDLMSAKKYEAEKKKACKNYCKSANPSNSSSFLSVTQLVDDKGLDKTTKKNPLDMPACAFGGEEHEKSAYLLNHKGADIMEYSTKKSCTNICKDTKAQQHMKCKKDTMKYQTVRCASKENKKDVSRHFAVQNCQVQNKEVNPLSSKNSNYSAESLIGSSNQNTSSTADYFPYENSANYGGCSTSDYSKKRTNDGDSLVNVGYYTNTNYVYPNNFQGFNNYGLSNQCYNNYSSQIQSNGFQKKKDDGYNGTQDASEWNLSSYNAIVQCDFSNNQKVDPKCKQSFSNKFNHQSQKNSINSEMYNKYYQVSPASSTLNQSKSSCAFNSTCSFNQGGGQSCVETNYLAPNYDAKSSRHSSTMNSNAVHSATTLTNFNLSTIFPEINDKPAAENNSDHFFSSSTFQIHNFTDFSSRKTFK